MKKATKSKLITNKDIKEMGAKLWKVTCKQLVLGCNLCSYEDRTYNDLGRNGTEVEEIIALSRAEAIAEFQYMYGIECLADYKFTASIIKMGLCTDSRIDKRHKD